MKSAPAIAFDYRPSRRVAAAAATIAVLAIVAILASGIGTPARLVLIVAVSAHAAWSLRRFLATPFVRVTRDAGGWQLVTREDERLAASLRGHVRLGPLLVLEFAVPGRRPFRCVLAGDVIDTELRRRLLLVLAREPRGAAVPGAGEP